MRRILSTACASVTCSIARSRGVLRPDPPLTMSGSGVLSRSASTTSPPHPRSSAMLRNVCRCSGLRPKASGDARSVAPMTNVTTAGFLQCSSILWRSVLLNGPRRSLKLSGATSATRRATASTTGDPDGWCFTARSRETSPAAVSAPRLAGQSDADMWTTSSTSGVAVGRVLHVNATCTGSCRERNLACSKARGACSAVRRSASEATAASACWSATWMGTWPCASRAEKPAG
mmetsp:Transcript_7737/g.26275  ORF Transcript_7737/g.26275 Transcript_7737/m.26275 type:complete len:232 (+) Transcript_7737:447-1142(+)